MFLLKYRDLDSLFVCKIAVISSIGTGSVLKRERVDSGGDSSYQVALYIPLDHWSVVLEWAHTWWDVSRHRSVMT